MLGKERDFDKIFASEPTRRENSCMHTLTVPFAVEDFLHHGCKAHEIICDAMKRIFQIVPKLGAGKSDPGKLLAVHNSRCSQFSE